MESTNRVTRYTHMHTPRETKRERGTTGKIVVPLDLGTLSSSVNLTMLPYFFTTKISYTFTVYRMPLGMQKLHHICLLSSMLGTGYQAV
jgi:hypothetical protein